MGSIELRAAAQQALEAWDAGDTEWFKRAYTVMDALKAALAEPVQGPVAWIHTDAYNPKNRYLEWSENRRGYLGDWIKTPLYAAPPQRKPLTEEKIDKAYREICRDLPIDFDHTPAGWIEQGIRYAERAHGIRGQP